MPRYYPILDLPDLELQGFQGEQTLELLTCAKHRPVCRYCGCPKLHLKKTFSRRLKHSRQGNRLIHLLLRVRKFRCFSCHKYFHERFAGILPRKQATETFRLEVFERHHAGVTQKSLSDTHGISSATVERWYQDFIMRRVKELSGRDCPRILGIDDHFFTKKRGYATTLVDLRNHRVFDVVLGRTETALGRYLSAIPGRDKVRVVVMDLSETYRRIVRRYFFNAKIVSDRFHVVRLWNHHFLKLWQQLDPEGRKNRGLLSLMRRHENRLTLRQQATLQGYLQHHLALKTVYEFKQSLMKKLLLKTRTRSQVKDELKEFLPMVQQLLESPWEAMRTFGKTVQLWLTEIVSMWRFSKSNGITEGFHTKMEMISRRAFGFRNFNNYRLRVLALCGWNGVWNRI